MNRFRQQIRACVCVHAEKVISAMYRHDDDGKNRKEVDKKVKI
jgi:hypothetical protein